LFQTCVATNLNCYISPQLFRKGVSCCLAPWSDWARQVIAGECFLQFLRVIGKGQLDLLTPLGWPVKNDLSSHNLSVEKAANLSLSKPHWILVGSK